MYNVIAQIKSHVHLNIKAVTGPLIHKICLMGT